MEERKGEKERRREGGREERGKGGRKEMQAACKRQIFLTLKMIFLCLFLYSGIKGAETACEK